jgi:hypothetical protein
METFRDETNHNTDNGQRETDSGWPLLVYKTFFSSNSKIL